MFTAKKITTIISLRKLKIYRKKVFAVFKYDGECSQVVKALGCGSSIRGFDSRHSPINNFFTFFYNCCVSKKTFRNFAILTASFSI